MPREFRVLNRQRSRRVDLRLLKQIIGALLTDISPVEDCDLAINLVGAKEMARLNEFHLGHSGSTDVITLDYSGGTESGLLGEIFICLDEAVNQAAQFGTTWPSELVRYVIHGGLHLEGFDDLAAPARRRMRREENRRLKLLERRFNLRKIQRESTLSK